MQMTKSSYIRGFTLFAIGTMFRAQMSALVLSMICVKGGLGVRAGWMYFVMIVIFYVFAKFMESIGLGHPMFKYESEIHDYYAPYRGSLYKSDMGRSLVMKGSWVVLIALWMTTTFMWICLFPEAKDYLLEAIENDRFILSLIYAIPSVLTFDGLVVTESMCGGIHADMLNSIVPALKIVFTVLITAVCLLLGHARFETRLLEIEDELCMKLKKGDS